MPMVSEYVNSLSPQISRTWHADELFVKVKGGLTRAIMGLVWSGTLWIGKPGF